ncbi:Nucleolar protein of 40 kDa [Lobosporangium transversale]|uniref:CCHC-type domain-containing protein n=1 Tax=Lobosporangium transversale TaxID=64571 RepID=A0A1Y2GKX1_9FUNG|nr:hypothetical protein BCR41DRAFT_355835 [Lobosporangium transversale]KAF9916626.1 Nucleolar protein of 40 kDa [Lobosporangium transversale]ORZ12886.1 hypothetical protein BCR41DRAFT_355835 [Lobosporangium transversale]|eukprot:XP_021880235.1 hypothetical protein BCR41DRAFT_355835 [Lobosporangium transversale]
MDSQQEAFERFKAANSGKRSTREGQQSRSSKLKEVDGPLPDLYSIHRGQVVRVEDYGAFVQIPGFRKQGLVHKRQTSNHFTENVSDVVASGDHVWVKVTSLQDGKIALSMKYVSQGDGTDLDPNLVKLTGEEDRKRTHTTFIDKQPIAIEEGGVFLKTVCKKCGASGHLATDCFSAGEQFELLADEDDEATRQNVVSAKERKHKSSRDKHKHNKDKDKGRDKDRYRDKERERVKESRRDYKDRKDSSSYHQKDNRRNRSRTRSPSPKRRMDKHFRPQVENLEDALAVMRAHKHRRHTKRGDGGGSEEEDKKKESRKQGYGEGPRSRSHSRSRSRSPRRNDGRRTGHDHGREHEGRHGGSRNDRQHRDRHDHRC